MTGQVKARTGQVFTVADDQVEGWVNRGYTEVTSEPAKPAKKAAKKSAAKKSDSK